MALKTAGDEPLLVTWSTEHLRLGFPARGWDDAFPLRLGSLLMRRGVPAARRRASNGPRPGTFGRLGGLARRMVMGIGAVVPRLLGRVSAVQDFQTRSATRVLELVLLDAPVIVWTTVVLAMHLLSMPLALLTGSARAFRGRPFSRVPSAIDPVMFVDAAIRTEWRDAQVPGARLLDRKLHHLLLDNPVPGRIIPFIDQAVSGADVVVIAEAPDDPIYERLILFFAHRSGIPCVRASCFPRALRPRGDHASFLAMSSLPLLLPLVCSQRPAANRMSFGIARLIRALFELVSGSCDLWYAAVGRRLFGKRSFLEFVNQELVSAGKTPVDWPALLEPDYVTTPRFNVYSSVVVADPNATGYWSLPAPSGWKPSPELVDFLDADVPVVYVSRVARSAGMQAALAGSLQQLPPCRLLVNIREDEALPALRDHPLVKFVESVPHQWLFARVAFAIHHAGAGTAAAVLRAGLPSLAVPTWGDQTLWAQRIHDLGAGPRPVHVRWVTASTLGRAIREGLTNPSLRQRAQAVSTQLATDDGLDAAIGDLRSLVTRSARDAAVGGLFEGGLHDAARVDDLGRPMERDRQSCT